VSPPNLRAALCSGDLRTHMSHASARRQKTMGGAEWGSVRYEPPPGHLATPSRIQDRKLPCFSDPTCSAPGYSPSSQGSARHWGMFLETTVTFWTPLPGLRTTSLDLPGPPAGSPMGWESCPAALGGRSTSHLSHPSTEQRKRQAEINAHTVSGAG
jgi:hypothetical protein